jgi:hypothetical protein
MTKSSPKKARVPSARSEDQPATRKMLHLVRDELKADVRSLESKMDAGFIAVRGEMAELRHEVRSGFAEIRSELQKRDAEHSRMLLLLEEQHANNKIVLEGLQALWQRQDRLERRLPPEAAT